MADVDFDMKSIEVPSKIVNGVRVMERYPDDAINAACKYRAQDNDLVLSTYLKCGSTWVQHMICHLLNYNDFDGDMVSVFEKIPTIDAFGIASLTPGSFYKTHLPFDAERFNPDAKYVLVMRNPRDVCVSYYHFVNMIPPGIPGLPKGTDWFPRFAELFCKGEVWYGSYMDYLRSWLEGIRTYGKPGNALILIYEEMKEDQRGELIRIANFLGGRPAELVKDEKVVETILERTSVSSMKKTCNTSMSDVIRKFRSTPVSEPDKIDFVRKGIVGDHVNYFSPEISRMFDDYIASDPRNQEIMALFNV